MDFVTPTAQVKVRFTVDDSPNNSLIESLVDDFIVASFECEDAGTCEDGIQNQGEDRIDCGGPCPPCECTYDAICDDGVFCNGTETCDAYGECQSDPGFNCSDGIDCTVDTCDEENDVCIHTVDDSLCLDDLFCNGEEWCNASTGCRSGTDPCPATGCDEDNDQCYECSDNAHCDDLVYCNGAETCVGGYCVAGDPIDCDDGVGCTLDLCDENDETCLHFASDGACDDGSWCNGVEFCDPDNDCQAGEEPCGAGTWCDEGSQTCVDYGAGDFDVDGDVDLDDFARFQACFADWAFGGCEPANFAGDGSVDLDDFAAFMLVLTGP